MTIATSTEKKKLRGETLLAAVATATLPSRDSPLGAALQAADGGLVRAHLSAALSGVPAAAFDETAREAFRQAILTALNSLGVAPSAADGEMPRRESAVGRVSRDYSTETLSFSPHLPHLTSPPCLALPRLALRGLER